MTSIENAVLAIEKALVTVLMVVAFLAMVVMVPARYFDWPLPDLTEASIAAVACLAFVCVGLLVRTGDHISIEIAALIPARIGRFAIRQLTNAGILLFVVVIGIQAVGLVKSAAASNEASIALHIPLLLPYAALVIGLALAAFHAVMNAARDIRVLRTPGAEFDDHLRKEVDA